MYFHYLPIGVEADAPPTRAQLGKAAVTWAAVSLADKLDTIVGLFAAGEKPTGSRDPYGLRRAAQGGDEDPDGLRQSRPAGSGVGLREMIEQALQELWRGAPRPGARIVAGTAQRVPHRSRDAPAREPRVPRRRNPSGRAALVETAAECASSGFRRSREARKSPDFEALARPVQEGQEHHEGLRRCAGRRVRAGEAALEPAELALLDEMRGAMAGDSQAALAQERYGDAMRELSALSKPVDQVFHRRAGDGRGSASCERRVWRCSTKLRRHDVYIRRRHLRNCAGRTVRLTVGTDGHGIDSRTRLPDYRHELLD